MSTDSEKTRLLVVDDETGMLSALKRLFFRGPYIVDTCESAKAAMEVLKNNQYDVIISDMRMPEIDGAKLLAHVAQHYPSIKRILLTGYSDQESTVRAVNEGQIHHYFSKPWDSDKLRDTVEMLTKERKNEMLRERMSTKLKSVNESLQKVALSLETQCESARAELNQVTSMYDMAKEEIYQTYEATIKMFAHMINMRLKNAPSLSQTIETDITKFCQFLGLDKTVEDEIRRAGLLYQLGKIGIEDNLLNIPAERRSKPQQETYNKYPGTGADALSALDSLSYTAKIVRHHMENVDGSGFPFGLFGQDIPLGSRILRLVIDYHTFRASERNPLSPQQSFDILREKSGSTYDADLAQAYLAYRSSNAVDGHDGCHAVTSDQIPPNALNGRDLFNREGLLMLAKGSRFTTSILNKLKQYEQLHNVTLTLHVKELL